MIEEYETSDDSENEVPSSSPNYYETESLRSRLKNWTLNYHISHSSLSALLLILQTHACFASLPLDARSLLSTPREVISKPVPPGHYCHLGLETSLKKIWKFVREKFDSIELLINIDGLPLFKSSKTELWPILGIVSNVPSVRSLVFPIGIYCGEAKPSKCSDFLADFVGEAKKLFTEGILINGQHMKVIIKGFICDAPAKSFLMNVKGHTGYYSCTKCKQQGEWINHRMTFPANDACQRTHAEFLRQEDEDFHTGVTALIEVPGLNFIDSFPLDYMHLVCLGVVRTIMNLWTFGPVPLKFPSLIINTISSKLVSLKQHMPMEFNRKPRSIDELRRWKATEYRTFLLYTGPVVLKSIFKGEMKSIYDHFLTLAISISILLSPSHCTEINLAYANTLLRHFVESTKLLYGHQYITHNFHGLIHLSESINIFGCLHNSSAFPFENFLQYLKKNIRKGHKPLEQVIKRCKEVIESDLYFHNNAESVKSPLFFKPHLDGPILPNSRQSQQYSQISFDKFKITTTHSDSCCFMKDGSIIVVKNIVFSTELKKMTILCREFLEREDFFGPPLISSSDLNIFLVTNLSDQLEEKLVEEIMGKMVLLPYENKQVAFPLLHTL